MNQTKGLTVLALHGDVYVDPKEVHNSYRKRRRPFFWSTIPNEWRWQTLKELEVLGIRLEALTPSGISTRPSGNRKPGKEVRFDVPIADTISLAEKRCISIGCARCRIRLLEKKTAFCFHCQERGHIAADYKGKVKERRCFRCGLPGHLVRDCHSTSEVMDTDSTSTARVAGERTGPRRSRIGDWDYKLQYFFILYCVI